MTKSKPCALHFCVFSVLFFIFQQGGAQEVKINKEYIKSYFTDAKKVAVAPYHWKKDEWIGMAVVAAGGTALYTQDKSIQELYQANRNDFRNHLSKYFFERIGSGVYSLPLMGIFYLQGALKKNDKSKATALLGIHAYLLAGTAVTVPKYLLQRHRPYQDDPANPHLWEGPFKGYSHYTSFPSGHTAAAFSMAAVLATQYKETEWVPLLSYSIAALTGLSRINDNKHWASDVFVGAALGYAVGKLVANNSPWNNATGFLKKKKQRPETLLAFE